MQLNGHEVIVLLGSLGIGGVAVTVVAELCKRVLKLKTEAVIHTLVVVLAGVGAFAQYINQLHAVLPPYVMGVSLTSIYGISQIAYRYSKYAGNFLGKVYAKDATPDTPALPVTSETPAPAVGEAAF